MWNLNVELLNVKCGTILKDWGQGRERMGGSYQRAHFQTDIHFQTEYVWHCGTQQGTLVSNTVLYTKKKKTPKSKLQMLYH